MNPIRTAKEAGHEWFERVWNGRNADAARELMAPEAVGYLEGGQTIIGPDAFLEFQAGFLAAVPDMRIRIIGSLADNNHVCLHWQAEGNHTGEGLGMPASQAPLSFQGVTWFTVKDGLITDGRDFWNMDSVMKTMSCAVTS